MKNEKLDVINNVKTLFGEREMFYSGFKSGIFPLPHQSIALDRPKKHHANKSTQDHHCIQAHQSTQEINMRDW